jgi:hypothetical protein
VIAWSSLPTSFDRPVWTSRSINNIIKVLCSYCDTIAIGNTLYWYELIWCQFSTNRFMSARAGESMLAKNHRVYNSPTTAANDRSLNMTMLYWSQIFIYLQLHCLPHIESRVTCTTQNTWIPSLICPDLEGVVDVWVDCYKSIQLTTLRDIEYWFVTYLSYYSAYLEIPQWFGIDIFSSY